MQLDGAHAIDVAMGEVIARNRRRCELSIGQLADAIGATAAQIKRYEAGTNKVSVSRLLQLAEVFEVAPSYLVAQVVVTAPVHHCRPGKNSPVSELLSSRQGQELVDAIAHVRTHGPGLMIDEIHALSKQHANTCVEVRPAKRL
ncbi:MAG: helix-turn-helix transcriptional regulator [Pseudomonadota bacterium]